MMNSTAAARLAGQLSTQQQPLCEYVSHRLLQNFPELQQTLRLEEQYSPVERLSEVAVGRLSELVRSVLLFELPSLVDREINWAHGVLPRRGVTYEHQHAMIRWFFEEVRRMSLSQAELEVAAEIEQYFLDAINQAYHEN
ncbi:MAG: hypothetical protein AB4911_22330 [Oscillochloridaceae bacterium umkhey_bin13]